MIAESVAILLTTMQNYLIMDSVVVDLDKPEECLPNSLEWTKRLDPRLVGEFLDTLESPIRWTLEKDVPKRNFTAYSYASPAYDHRRVFMFRAIFPASVEDVVRGSWIQSTVEGGWNSEFSASKVLEYGGRNKFVIWHRTHSALAGLVPARDFIGYHLKVDCASELHPMLLRRKRQVALSLNMVPDEDENCTAAGPVVIVWTNTSRHFDYPRDLGVVRAEHGTSGFYIQAIRTKDPPVTYAEGIMNADVKRPSVVPESIFRRFAVAKALTSNSELNAYLRRGRRT